MLMTLAVFTVLGAALAFKAKTFNTIFCTTTYSGGSPVGICNSTTLLSSQQVLGDPNVYATSFDKEDKIITTTLQCTDELDCPAVRLIVD